MSQPFQFSLRAVLVLMVVAACVFAMCRSTAAAIFGVVVLSLLHLNVMVLVSRRTDESESVQLNVTSFGWVMFLPMMFVGMAPALGCVPILFSFLWLLVGPLMFWWVVSHSREAFVIQPDLRRPFLASCCAMFVCQGWMYYWAAGAISIPMG